MRIYDSVRTNLASLVEEFRRHAGETAVVAYRGNRRYATSYGALAELAGRFAAELDRRGIGPGERVVLWGANSAEWMAAFYGCLLRGAIAVPLDAGGSPEFARRVVSDVAPRLIAGDLGLLNTLAGDEIPRLRLFRLGERLPAEPNYAVSEAVAPEAPFQIVFTSGTTSEPKGIVHTHGNVLASVLPIEREMAKYRRYERWVHPLRFLHTLPLSHVFGQFMGLWLPPLLAAEVHFAEQLEARRMTELICRERISVLVTVPRILHLVRAHLAKRFPSLEEQLRAPDQPRKLARWWRYRQVHSALGWKFWAVISGGAALPEELEKFWNGLGIALIQGYGMTETTALVTLNHPFRTSRGSMGKALPGREVRLSEDGEIEVRGDMLAAATWSRGAMHPRQGEWLSTGDLGARDERGELRFLGRKGDVIVTGGGMNVHPDDLQAAMKRQPAIYDCAVVPVETSAGVEPVAVVLTSAGEPALREAIREANRELAEFQQIRRVLRWPEPQFPFTSTGKLLRRRVAEWAAQTLAESTQAGPQPGGRQASPSPGRSLGEILLGEIAEVTGENRRSSAPAAATEAEDRLRLGEDLHLDSLGRVQLQTALEQLFRMELEDDAVATAETLGDLKALFEAAAGGEKGGAHATRPPRSASPRATDGATAAEGGGEAVAEGPPSGVQAVASEAEKGGDGRLGPDRDLDRNRDRLYPYWPWIWPFSALRVVFLELVMRPLTRLLAAPRVVRAGGGLQGDLRPGTASGPMLVVANHVTAYDGALVLYALPGWMWRRMAIAMSGEMLLDYRMGRNQGNALLNLAAPPQYWLVTALFNVFPLPRLHGFRRSFLHAGEALDRGYSVMVFPEGARHLDGVLRPFRSGIGLLARESLVPVLPVALVGLSEANRKGWFRSGLVEIRVGEPIPVDESDEPAELTARFEEAVRTLMA